MEGFVSDEAAVVDAVAAGGLEEEGTEADQSPGGDAVFQADIAGPVVVDVGQLSETASQVLGEGADELLPGVYDELFDGFLHLAADHPGDGLGLGNLELIPFPAHGFHEDGQVQLAPAGNEELVGGSGGFHAEADVGAELPQQPLVEVAGGAVFTFPAHHWGGVDAEGHLDGGFLDGDGGHGFGEFGVGDGVADAEVAGAGYGHDAAGGGLFHLVTFQAVKNEDTVQVAGAGVSFTLDAGDGSAGPEGAAGNPSDADGAEVIVVVQGSHQHLQRGGRVARRGRNGVENRLEQGLHVPARLGRVGDGDSLAGRSVEDGEVQLVGIGGQLQEEVLDQLGNLVQPGPGGGQSC